MVTWVREFDRRYLVHQSILPVAGVWLAWDLCEEYEANDLASFEFYPDPQQFWRNSRLFTRVKNVFW